MTWVLVLGRVIGRHDWCATEEKDDERCESFSCLPGTGDENNDRSGRRYRGNLLSFLRLEQEDINMPNLRTFTIFMPMIC
jgi:hypothetical protein